MHGFPQGSLVSFHFHKSIPVDGLTVLNRNDKLTPVSIGMVVNFRTSQDNGSHCEQNKVYSVIISMKGVKSYPTLKASFPLQNIITLGRFPKNGKTGNGKKSVYTPFMRFNKAIFLQT